MKWKKIGFGVSIQPFWWQWGDVSHEAAIGRFMYAIGPFRIAVQLPH